MSYSQAVRERFLTKIGIDGECRPWQGRQRPSGHGLFDVAPGKVRQAHRIAYELFIGPVPPKMVVAQTCKLKRCCAEDHLELITQGEANRRGSVGLNMVLKGWAQTHCKHGHSLSDAYVRSSGKRQCRECHKIAQRKRVRR